MQTPPPQHRRLQLQSTLVPTRRQRAVPAAYRNPVRPPPHWCTRKRPLQLLPLLRTAQPQQRDEPGRNARHPALPTYVSSSVPLQATALLHACADAQGLTTDCAVGPPATTVAAPISASAAVAVVYALPTQIMRAHARHPIVWRMHAAPSCGACTLDRLDRCIDPAAVCSSPSLSPLICAWTPEHRTASTARCSSTARRPVLFGGTGKYVWTGRSRRHR